MEEELEESMQQEVIPEVEMDGQPYESQRMN